MFSSYEKESVLSETFTVKKKSQLEDVFIHVVIVFCSQVLLNRLLLGQGRRSY